MDGASTSESDCNYCLVCLCFLSYSYSCFALLYSVCYCMYVCNGMGMYVMDHNTVNLMIYVVTLYIIKPLVCIFCNLSAIKFYYMTSKLIIMT